MRPRRTVPWTWIGAGAAALGLVAAGRLLPLRDWIGGLREYVAGLGVAGGFLYGAVYVVAALLFVPGILLTVGAGFAFGLLWGTVLVSAASTAAAAAAGLPDRTLRGALPGRGARPPQREVRGRRPGDREERLESRRAAAAPAPDSVLHLQLSLRPDRRALRALRGRELGGDAAGDGPLRGPRGRGGERLRAAGERARGSGRSSAPASRRRWRSRSSSPASRGASSPRARSRGRGREESCSRSGWRRSSRRGRRPGHRSRRSAWRCRRESTTPRGTASCGSTSTAGARRLRGRAVPGGRPRGPRRVSRTLRVGGRTGPRPGARRVAHQRLQRVHARLGARPLSRREHPLDVAPFGARRHAIGGRLVSLDDLEHGSLRPEYGFRIHAAISCASRSCPPLAATAWEASSLTSGSTPRCGRGSRART